MLFPCLKKNGIYIIEDLNWQSPNYEEKLPGVPKTIDLLMQLKTLRDGSNMFPKDYLFREEIMEFLEDIESIEFYCDRKLAAIKKI